MLHPSKCEPGCVFTNIKEVQIAVIEWEMLFDVSG